MKHACEYCRRTMLTPNTELFGATVLAQRPWWVGVCMYVYYLIRWLMRSVVDVTWNGIISFSSYNEWFVACNNKNRISLLPKRVRIPRSGWMSATIQMCDTNWKRTYIYLSCLMRWTLHSKRALYSIGLEHRTEQIGQHHANSKWKPKTST